MGSDTMACVTCRRKITRGPTFRGYPECWICAKHRRREQRNAGVRPKPPWKAERKSIEWSFETRRRLFKLKQHCHWCGIRLRLDTASVDHIIPISRGGTNLDDNLTLTCRPCNMAKADRMPAHREVKDIVQ